MVNFSLISDRVGVLVIKTVRGPLVFFNIHCEHEMRQLSEIQHIWELLELLWNQFPDAWGKLLVGDFNMRLHGREEGEEWCLGPHVVGRGLAYLYSLAHHHNRNCFMDFAHERSLKHLNSRFGHPLKHKFTFCELASSMSSPMHAEHFTELDHAVANAVCLPWVRNVWARSEYCGFPNHSPLQIDIHIRLNPPKLKKNGPRADYTLLADDTMRSKFVSQLLKQLPSPRQVLNVNQFYLQSVQAAVDTQEELLLPPSVDSNERFKTKLKVSTQTKFHKSVALARTGDLTAALQVYKQFRNCVKVNKREALESQFDKAKWSGLSPEIRLHKFIKGSATVRNENKQLLSAESRAPLFGKYLHSKVWSLQEASQGPIPMELEGIQMYITPWELQEALVELNKPCTVLDIKYLRKGLKTRKSRKPSGVDYEAWISLLSTVEGRNWFMAAFNVIFFQQAMPDAGNLICVTPGYKGKGVGGPQEMKNYRAFGLSCTFGRLIRRVLAYRLMVFLKRFLPNTFFGGIPGVSTDDPLTILSLILENSRWLAEYCIKLLSIDLLRAFDSLTKQSMKAALAAWGISEGPFFHFLLSSQNCKFYVEGLKEMPNSDIYNQMEGEGTGAPESPALFLMVLSWFLVALQRFERNVVPKDILEDENLTLPVR